MHTSRQPGPWAIVVNPTKYDDLSGVKNEANAKATELGWPEPQWIETTEEDPGTGQTNRALDEGAVLVVAAGGDGTVRTVGGAMRATGTALGIIPAGTGNLLARNLGLPLNSIGDAVAVALQGNDRPIDVGLASYDDQVDDPFFVMSGVGLDAQIMDQTSSDLKHRIGWVAYIGGIVRSLKERGFKSKVSVGAQSDIHSHSRMVLICNCPQLTGGLEMAVDGTMDDGLLDVVTVRVKGPFGWFTAINHLISRARHRSDRIHQLSGESVEVLLDRPVPAELDGDLLDSAVRKFSARVEPGALVVRVGDETVEDRNLVGLLVDSTKG